MIYGYSYSAIGLSIASVAVALILVKHGYTEKLYAASALFLRLVVSFLLAMTFYKPLTVLVSSRLTAVGENLVMRITFLVLLWGGYVVLTELYERRMEPEHVILPKTIDRVGGMIFGAAAGAVLVGLLLLTWSFIPFTQKIGPLPNDMPVDMGRVLINEYANLSNRMPSPGKFDRDEEKKAYLAMHEVEPETPPSAAPKGKEEPASPGKTGPTGAAKPPASQPPSK